MSSHPRLQRDRVLTLPTGIAPVSLASLQHTQALPSPFFQRRKRRAFFEGAGGAGDFKEGWARFSSAPRVVTLSLVKGLIPPNEMGCSISVWNIKNR